MKNSTTIAILMIFSLSMNAQKTIEKNIDYRGQEINIDLDFATNIQIKTWEKPSVYIKADLSTEDGKYLDLYSLIISDGDSRINVKSDALPVFEASKKRYEKNDPNQVIIIKKSKTHYIHQLDLKYEFNYIIYIPKDAKLKISSITGNFNSENIEGDITADLISGNITINRYKGNLNLSSISGEIDLRLINTTLVAETLEGNIYVDEKLKLAPVKQSIGQRLEGETENSNNSLKINTISGNIYLRP